MWKSDHDLEIRFAKPENSEVIRYLKQESPSAHGDLVDELYFASDEIEGRQSYCPDVQKFAYFLLHTTSGVIYAIAIGMGVLAFRLPKDEVKKALSAGGTLYSNLGEDWVAFNPFRQEISIAKSRKELKRWCELAFQKFKHL